MQPAPAPVEEEAYAHPIAAFFHVCFKIAALVVYILFNWIFPGSFIINFVCCLVSLMLDFWVTKNITGRLLVGLRWWNDVGDPETGEGSHWRFESLQEGQRAINKKDSWVFWTALYATPCIWAVLGLLAIIRFKFEYALVVVLAFVLSSANLAGYTRCSKDAQKQVQSFASNAITSGIQAAIRNRTAAAGLGAWA